MPLTSAPPESACKPSPPRREPLTRVSENEPPTRARTPSTAGDGAAASNVKGPHKRKASSPEGVVDAGCWWGHGLAAERADSDDDDGTRRATFKTPFSAARTERGAIAGDARARCKLCDGEFARDDVALLGGCNHHFCVPCVEIWSSRRARSCPTCKATFDGWHYGEVVPCGADEDGAGGGGGGGGGTRRERRFHRLPPPTGERMPARSARALAFDVGAPGAFASFGAVEDPEEDEDAAREMREAESRDEGAEEPTKADEKSLAKEPRADDRRAKENDDDDDEEEWIGERIDRAKRRRMPSNGGDE